jgi:hypothetical protein
VLVKEPKNIDGILSEYAYLVGLTFFCFRNTFQNSNNSVFLSTTGKSLTMRFYIGDCYLMLPNLENLSITNNSNKFFPKLGVRLSIWHISSKILPDRSNNGLTSSSTSRKWQSE